MGWISPGDSSVVDDGDADGWMDGWTDGWMDGSLNHFTPGPELHHGMRPSTQPSVRIVHKTDGTDRTGGRIAEPSGAIGSGLFDGSFADK